MKHNKRAEVIPLFFVAEKLIAVHTVFFKFRLVYYCGKSPTKLIVAHIVFFKFRLVYYCGKSPTRNNRITVQRRQRISWRAKNSA
jgi:hypothetical protein